MVKISAIFSILSIILGLYIINGTFAWISMPNFILDIGQWITAVAGIFLVFYGLTSMFKQKQTQQ